MTGLFFDIQTDADKKLMASYDDAVIIFRAEVSKLYEDMAAVTPHLQKELMTAAEALRLRPLPSEANSDPEALRRLVLSSRTVEMVFGRIQEEGEMELAGEIAASMREISKSSVGQPELKPLTEAAIRAVSRMKPEVAKDMEGLGFDEHIAALKKMAAAYRKQTPPARKGPHL